MYKYKNKTEQPTRVYNENNGAWLLVEPQGIVELNYKMDNPQFEVVVPEKTIKVKK